MQRNHSLELRIPPLAVLAVFGGVVWAATALTPEWTTGQWHLARRVLAAALISLGAVVAIAGVREFRQHKTTVNPMRPDASSTIVESGIYRWSRNPMYLGMHLSLLGWSVWLGNPWGLVVAQAFPAYITQFQIIPEERLLAAQFGPPYANYTRRVSRWFGTKA